MANVLVEENSLTAIANSIRGKNGTTNTYKPGEMAAAINAIETGGVSEVRYQNLYYDSYYTDASSYLQSFDVSNATTLTFLYDYASASTPCTGTIRLYLGSEIYQSSGNYSYRSVDATTSTQTVLSSNRTNFTNRTLTVDVSNYTSVVLYTSFASNNSTSAKGCICIHDIVIS